MIDLAASYGLAAKFTGSGGAVVCMRDFESQGTPLSPTTGPDASDTAAVGATSSGAAAADGAPPAKRPRSEASNGAGAAAVVSSSMNLSDPQSYVLNTEEERAVKASFAAQGFEFMRVRTVTLDRSLERSTAGMVLQLD